MDTEEVCEINCRAWNNQSRSEKSPWVIPASRKEINEARSGKWDVILTPTRKVPRKWFGQLENKSVLCLASGGGQQAPILAAAGAKVTSFDNSEEQLNKDRMVARRENLEIECLRGKMTDLGAFSDQSFDIIFHPISNVFVPNVELVWEECYRVLKTDGRLLAGFMNPHFYLFDHEDIKNGLLPQVKFMLPYSDTLHFSREQLLEKAERGEGIEFSHSLDKLIGGQLSAGFMIAGFYEDRWTDEATPISKYFPVTMATLSLKAQNQ